MDFDRYFLPGKTMAESLMEHQRRRAVWVFWIKAAACVFAFACAIKYLAS
jgi:hypothetical protein